MIVEATSESVRPGPSPWETPSGPRIVLLHGITGSRRIFRWLEERLRSAPTNAETHSFDLPGFGDNVRLAGSYEFDDQLAFITKSIEDRFPSGPLVLIGHSLGGVLALGWTIAHPARVSRLVLLNAPLAESRGDMMRALTRNRYSWASLLLRHERLAHLACLILRGANLMRLFRFAKPAYVPDDVFRDYGQHTWTSLVRTFHRVLLEAPGEPLLRQIPGTPILNLVGRADDEISRRTISLPNVENVALPGGHLMLLENPEETARAIEEFLMGRPLQGAK